MRMEITHLTKYSYGQPAAEAYLEVRMTPPESGGQKVLRHTLECDPVSKLSSYEDFFGNIVHFFSLPFQHRQLDVINKVLVETNPQEHPRTSLDISVEEARQIFSSAMPDVFAYLQETDLVTLGNGSVPWVRKFFRGDISLGDGMKKLVEAIHDTFEYRKGSTTTSTSLDELWRTKCGVCQDFAHVGLSVLRTAGLPARYVCGYIDAGGGGRQGLVGALATHAWIEVLVPGMQWVAIDPTNRRWCNDQYVAVSYGRDFRDASPLRGIFKGSGGQKMKVKVYVKHKKGK